MFHDKKVAKNLAQTMGIRPRGSWWLRRTTRSAIRQELQPKMDKPLGRNSKPYHIHTNTAHSFAGLARMYYYSLFALFTRRWKPLGYKPPLTTTFINTTNPLHQIINPPKALPLVLIQRLDVFVYKYACCGL